MFLYLPKHFDQNEWFIMIGLVLSISLVRLPKRIPTEISYLVVLLSLAIPNIIDHSIAAISPYDVYRINDSEKYEIFDVLLSGIYVPFGFLCVYFYEWLKPRRMMIVFYILCWDLFAVFFEYVIIKLHIFTYHGWSLYYSIPTYLLVISILLYYYEFLLRNYKVRVISKSRSNKIPN